MTNFNVEWNVETLCIAAVILVVLAGTLLLMVTLLMMRNFKPEKSTRLTKTGTYCGHCGCSVSSDPTRVVAMANLSLFVYHCKGCNNETMLPTQKLS